MSSLAICEIVSPLPVEDRFHVWEWLNFYSRQTLDTASPQTFEDFCLKDERDRENGGVTYGLYREDVLCGAVWMENAGDGIGIGHLVFDPKRTAGKIARHEKAEMVKDCLKMAFEVGYRKIVWTFFADNRIFADFLSFLGATHEGLFRKQVRRGEELVDQAFMASFPG